MESLLLQAFFFFPISLQRVKGMITIILSLLLLAESTTNHTILLNVSHIFESPLPAFYFLEGSSEGSNTISWGVAPNVSCLLLLLLLLPPPSASVF